MLKILKKISVYGHVTQFSSAQYEVNDNVQRQDRMIHWVQNSMAPSSNLSYLYQSLCYVSQIGKWGFINYACTYHNAFLLKRYVVNILSIIRGVKFNILIYFSSSFSSNVYLIKWGGGVFNLTLFQIQWSNYGIQKNGNWIACCTFWI